MKIALFPGLAPFVAAALLVPVAASAQTPFTATGWVNGVLAPGIWATNALGQVTCRGIVQTARVESTDARKAGQVCAICDAAANADGTANMQGAAYLQVGTWDPAGTSFTPSGGVWALNWRGVMQTNHSFQLSQTGYGIGGDIDGLCLEETVTRGPAANPLDPTVPWLYAGTIKPPPVNTQQVLDDFSGPLIPVNGTIYGNGTCYNSNGQFYAVGTSFHRTTSIYDSYVMAAPNQNLVSFPDGITREWRADLVSLDADATNFARLVVSDASTGIYCLMKGRDVIFLHNWLSGHDFSIFACDRVATPNSNVVLCLALTRVQQNLVITARVLDKADPSVALYQRTVVDTPNADPTLTAAEFQASTGMSLGLLNPDKPGTAFPFLTSVGAALGVFQYTDGHQPVPTAVFDNLELRTLEIPPVGIERAVRLSWPASTTINYTVEAAPTLEGPWLPQKDLTMPGMQQTTIPATSPAQFIRLIQAP